MYECKNLYYAKIEISQSTKMTAHEFHIPVTARLPSLPAMIHGKMPLQRSDCDWAGVSLNVTEILIFNCQSSLK